MGYEVEESLSETVDEQDKLISNLVKSNTRQESVIRHQKKLLVECRRALKASIYHFTMPDKTVERIEKLLTKL